MKIEKLYISEIFESIQGEGALTGFRTLFVRLGGCRIKCKWCDTVGSWRTKKKDLYKAASLVHTITERIVDGIWLCVTGGEPLEQLKSILWVLSKLKNDGLNKFSLETCGVVAYDKTNVILPDQKDVVDLYNTGTFFSISPKLRSALNKKFTMEGLKEIVHFWSKNILMPYRLQYKFVVSCQDDLNILYELFNEFECRNILYIQVEDSKINDTNFINKCLIFTKIHNNFRLTIQQHKVLKLR